MFGMSYSGLTSLENVNSLISSHMGCDWFNILINNIYYVEMCIFDLSHFGNQCKFGKFYIVGRIVFLIPS